MEQQLFDFDKRAKNAAAAAEYLTAAGLGATEIGLIWMFMMHEKTELFRASPQMVRLPISLAAAARWIPLNYRPCRELRLHRSTVHKKFQLWKSRGVMDRPPAGPAVLCCNFSAAQQYADRLHEALDGFVIGLSTAGENASENAERSQPFPGVPASIDRLNEDLRIHSINPSLLAALKKLPLGLWAAEASDSQVMRIVRDWANAEQPEIAPLSVLAAVLAARHGAAKTDPIAYVVSVLSRGVRQNWITHAQGLIQRESARRTYSDYSPR